MSHPVSQFFLPFLVHRGLKDNHLLSSSFVESNLNSQKPSFDLKNAVATAFTAATIASSAFAPMAAQAVDFTPSSNNFGTSTVIAEKFVREGIYGEYEVDLVQQYDDPRSTFKPAKETKSKKGTS
jgi:hypothetical protein